MNLNIDRTVCTRPESTETVSKQLTAGQEGFNPISPFDPNKPHLCPDHLLVYMYDFPWVIGLHQASVVTIHWRETTAHNASLPLVHPLARVGTRKPLVAESRGSKRMQGRWTRLPFDQTENNCTKQRKWPIDSVSGKGWHHQPIYSYFNQYPLLESMPSRACRKSLAGISALNKDFQNIITSVLSKFIHINHQILSRLLKSRWKSASGWFHN